MSTRKFSHLPLFAFVIMLSAKSSWADFNKGLDAYRKKDYVTALNEWESEANLGHAGAQYGIGLIYDYGRGAPQDFRKAVDWYRKAAEQGHAGSQHNLGASYEIGQGVSKDIKKAIDWYRKSANQGYPPSLNRLGFMYSYGIGTPKNIIAAHALYSVSSMLGNRESQNEHSKVLRIISNPNLRHALSDGQKLSTILYNIQALTNSNRTAQAQSIYQRSSLTEALDDYVKDHPWID